MFIHAVDERLHLAPLDVEQCEASVLQDGLLDGVAELGLGDVAVGAVISDVSHCCRENESGIYALTHAITTITYSAVAPPLDHQLDIVARG